MKTKTIRIPVAVDTNGNWNAVGASWFKDETFAAAEARSPMFEGDLHHLVWVTAEVPVPEPPPEIEVRGAVSLDGSE